LIQDEKLKEVFELFDVNHSGSISSEEVKKILGGKGLSDVDESEWERIVEEVDVDGDGVISYDEFRLIIYTLLGVPVPPDLEE
jgi:Ca2+-binding EF-hand superfamily protein